MSRGSSGSQSLGPLSVGNVITAALRLYRDHFKNYFIIALKASLWSIIPVYGWAKYAALLAVISRLAYGEVREQPETTSEAQRELEPRKWTFLGAYLLIGLIVVVGTIVLCVIAAIAVRRLIGNVLGVLLLLILLLIWFYGLIWVYSRYSVADMVIAMEGERKSFSAMNRSVALSQGYIWRIQLIYFVAFLVTIPIIIAISSIFGIFISILNMQAESSILVNLFQLVGGAFLAPFWMSIKAILYYDLRNRKEGLDLKDRLV